nr:hypothetical protein [Stenotrophomonas maltophilia]
MLASCSSFLFWAAVTVATLGLLFRPFRIPEYVWALGAALLLPLLGTVPFGTTLHAVAEGRDVYLFLIGMMMLAGLARLARLARREGLFDPAQSFPGTQAQGGMGGSGQAPVDTVHRTSGNRTLLNGALARESLKLSWHYEVAHLSTHWAWSRPASACQRCRRWPRRTGITPPW